MITHQEDNKDYYFVPKSIEEGFEFWNIVMDGANTAANELGINIHFAGTMKETNIEGQIAILKEIIPKKPKAIIIAPADQDLLIPVCQQIMEEGIQLVLIDSDVNMDKPKALIQTDNLAAASAVARNLAEHIDRNGKVAIFSHVEGTSTAIQREKGFRQAMENYEDIAVYETTFFSDGQENKAYEEAMNFFSEHHDITAIFATNEKTAMGVGKALKDLKLEEKIIFVGFDADATQVQFIEEGIMLGSMVQKPFNMGYIGVKEAYGISELGKEPTYIDTGFQWIDKENLFTPENQKLLFPFAE